MCGIAGFIGACDDQAGQARLDAFSRALRHRGPDGSGRFTAVIDHGRARVGLAHTRLAIIDPAGGAQPMLSRDGRLALVFNGEIYNFRELRAELSQLGQVFHTSCDSEVVLCAYAAWGERFVDRLRGMFALAVWDSHAETLLLARDRFGEKPLFYGWVAGCFVFASEAGAITSLPGFSARLDDEALPLFLQYRYTPAPLTLLDGVRKLMPGCIARVTTAGVEESRYYRPPDARATVDGAVPGDVAATFRNQLDEAVGAMMVSDVPFGAFLSGGIDSSAIVALMARRSSQPIRTFAVGFEESGYSELDAAQTVARHCRTEHHALTLRTQDVCDLLVDAARWRDAPVAEPADLPMLLLAREASRSVKMVLTGEGSDESLGGYPKHLLELGVGPYQSIPAALRQRLLEPGIAVLPYGARRLRTAAAAMSLADAVDRLPRWFGALSVDEVTALIGRRPQLNGYRYPFETEAAASPLRKILYFDQTSWLPDNLLERGDRMTMAASIEARMPFLDHRLIEFVSRLPDRIRLRAPREKWLLREAMKPLLPRSTLQRRKVGFRMPVHLWLRNELRPLLHELLQGADSFCRRRMDPAVIDRYIEQHASQRHNHEKPLWMLLNLEIWARHMRLTA